jgi:dienelactone hydrolase
LPLFALAVLGLAGARGDDKPKLDEQVAKARAFVAALFKEDYAAAGKDFDDVMKNKAPADKLKELRQGLLKGVGPFKKEKAVRTESAAKYDYVYVTCQFEKKDLDVKVVFTKDKQITGFFLVPPKGTYEYKAPPYARPDSFRESAVVVGEGEWALPGTLTLPKGDGPFPAVVLVHGSGPHDRDETIGPNKTLRDLAWGLASRGIAVLRYEKRTREHGPRFAQVKNYTVKEEVLDDVQAALKLLRGRKEIDKKRTFVVGHSLGALMAPRIGALEPDLAGLVMLAAPSRPLEDVILEQITYVRSLNPSEDDKEELEKLKKQVARLKDPKLSPDTPSSELPLGVSAAYWLALRAYDPVATAAKLKMPLLILQGERDYQVTMADFAGWKKALGSRKDVRLKSYPKLNHLFMEGEGKAKPQEYDKPGHVAGEVIDDVAAWVKK